MCKTFNIVYLIKTILLYKWRLSIFSKFKFKRKNKNVSASATAFLSEQKLTLPFCRCQCYRPTFRKSVSVPGYNNQPQNEKEGIISGSRDLFRFIYSLQEKFSPPTPSIPRITPTHTAALDSGDAGLFREQPLRGAGRWTALAVAMTTEGAQPRERSAG